MNPDGIYTVKKGETLNSISDLFHVPVLVILKMNEFLGKSEKS
jgi:LysM repeat protein